MIDFLRGKEEVMELCLLMDLRYDDDMVMR